jgi:hypothetical protein
MNCRSAAPGLLGLFLLTGCPSEFGKDGRVSKAIHQDTQGLVIKQCSDKRRREVCGGGKENTDQCRRECG